MTTTITGVTDVCEIMTTAANTAYVTITSRDNCHVRLSTPEQPLFGRVTEFVWVTFALRLEDVDQSGDPIRDQDVDARHR